MKSKKMILKKDLNTIDNEGFECKQELERMQSFVNWYNSLHYVKELTDTKEVKKYLCSTKTFHDTFTLEYLKSKMPELPPNIAPLKEMYNISSCDNVDFSEDNPHFEYLELQDGVLIYNQSLYDEIEVRNTFYASPEQARTIKELDRTFNNCMQIAEYLSPDSETWRRLYKDQFEKAFSLILKKTGFNISEDGNLTAWDLEKLDILVAKGFVTNNKDK